MTLLLLACGQPVDDSGSAWSAGSGLESGLCLGDGILEQAEAQTEVLVPAGAMVTVEFCGESVEGETTCALNTSYDYRRTYEGDMDLISFYCKAPTTWFLYWTLT